MQTLVARKRVTLLAAAVVEPVDQELLVLVRSISPQVETVARAYH
jgi:hypothetical protein